MLTNKLSRREFLRLGALAGGAALLAACGPAPATEAPRPPRPRRPPRPSPSSIGNQTGARTLTTPCSN